MIFYCMPDYVGNARAYVWNKNVWERGTKKDKNIYITEEKITIKNDYAKTYEMTL